MWDVVLGFVDGDFFYVVVEFEVDFDFLCGEVADGDALYGYLLLGWDY